MNQSVASRTRDFLAPLNTKALAVAGAAMAVACMLALGKMLSDGDFLLSFFLAVKYHRDAHPIFAVFAAFNGIAIGLLLAYFGKPASVSDKGAPTPPPELAPVETEHP